MYRNGPLELLVTTSIGAAAFRSNKPKETGQLIQMVDKALYQAKDGGRNRVVSYEES